MQQDTGLPQPFETMLKGSRLAVHHESSQPVRLSDTGLPGPGLLLAPRGTSPQRKSQAQIVRSPEAAQMLVEVNAACSEFLKTIRDLGIVRTSDGGDTHYSTGLGEGRTVRKASASRSDFTTGARVNVRASGERGTVVGVDDQGITVAFGTVGDNDECLYGDGDLHRLELEQVSDDNKNSPIVVPLQSSGSARVSPAPVLRSSSATMHKMDSMGETGL